MSSALGGLLLGAAALGISTWLVGGDRQETQQTTTQTITQQSNATVSQSADIFANMVFLAPPPEPPPPPPLPLFGIGGVQDTLRPLLTSVQNVKNKYGPIPRVYGKYKMFPYLAGDSVTLYEGNDSYILALYLVGYGPVDITDIRIDDKPIADIPEIQYEVVENSLTDPAITLYTQDIAEQQINEELKYDTLVTKTAPQPADKLSVDVTFNSGLFGAASFDLEYRLAGTSDPWVHVPPDSGPSGNPTITVSDNTTSVARGNKTWNVTRGLYEIRIKRLTTDGTVGPSYWSVTRAIKNSPAVNYNRFIDHNGDQYPISLIAVKAKATDRVNGTLGQLSCMVESLLSTWDGSAWTAATATHNPAWIIADLLTGTVNKRAMNKSELDLTSFKEFADFCTEKGIEFNAIFDTATECFEACKQVAALGRATLDLKDGSVGICIDKKRTTVVQHFFPTNIVKDSWNGEQERPRVPHALRMSFINPDANWEQDERIVYVDGYNEDNATDLQTVPLFGCTSKDQAYKDGRYRLGCIILRPRNYTFIVDVHGLICTRNDLVRLTHDAGLIGIAWGYIQSVVTDGSGNVTAVNMRQSVTLEAGKTYGFQGIRLDGTVFDATVSNSPGATTTLSFVTAIPAAEAPEAGDRFAVGELGKESLDLVVDKIEYLNDYQARLTCVDHAPAIYDADTGVIPPFESNITNQHEINMPVDKPVVLTVASDESVLARDPDGSYRARIQISLQPAPANIQYCQAQFKRSDGNQWSASQDFGVGNGEVSIAGVEDGVTYDVRLRYINSLQKPSDYTYILNHTVIGKTSVPTPVDKVWRNGDYILWQKSDLPRDFAGYRVVGNQGLSHVRNTAVVIADLVVGTQFNISQIPKGTYSIGVSVVDTSGNESETQWYTADIGDVTTTNLYYRDESAPTFPGTITNGVIESGVLKAVSLGSSQFWKDDTQPFWAPRDTDLFWVDSYGTLIYEREFVPPSGLNQPYSFVLDTDIDAENLLIEFLTGGATRFWDSDTIPFWKSSSTLFWVNDVWTLWPGRVDGSYQTYKLRVTATSGSGIRAAIRKFDILIDVPDINEKFSGILIPAGGRRLPIQNQYHEIKVLTYGVRYDATYPNIFTVRDTDRDPLLGPYVKAYDTSGAEVAGYADVDLTGW